MKWIPFHDTAPLGDGRQFGDHWLTDVVTSTLWCRLKMRPRAVGRRAPLAVSMRRLFPREYERENSSAAGVVRDFHLAAMGTHGFFDDRKPQTRAFRLRSFPAPETIEDSLAVRHRHATPLV